MGMGRKPISIENQSVDFIPLILKDTMSKYRLVKFENVKYVISFDIVDFFFSHVF